MARNLGTLTLDLVLKMAGFTQGMDRAARETERGARRIQQNLTGLSRSFSLVTRTLGAFGVGFGLHEIIQATAEAEKSFALLENAVANNAGAAGKTAKELSELATQLQHVSTFSDEAIQDAEALLLTFQSIKGDNFDRATQSVLDLATRLGKDLPSAALLVGKALEDPIKGMNQLARSGVVLDASQKRLIKSLVDTGRTAEAQEIILQELESTYAGAAAAARDNFGGALQGLKNDLGNLLEAKGGLPEATAQINAFSKALQDPATKAAVDSLIAGILKLGSTAATVLGAIGEQAFATEGSLLDIGTNIENIRLGRENKQDFEDVAGSIAKIQRRLDELAPRLARGLPVLQVPIEFVVEEKNLRARLKALQEELDRKPIVGAGPRGFGTPAMVNAANAKLSAAEFEELDKILERTASTTERVNKEIELLKKAYAAGELGVDEFRKSLAALQAQQSRGTGRRVDPAPQLKEIAVTVQEITVSATEQLYRDMDAATQTSLERQLAEWEQFTANVQALVDAGRITQEEALKRNAEKTDEFLQEIEITAERMTVPVQEAVNELSVFGEQAARNLQDAFADFLFDPFEDGLDGMLNSFAQTLQRMAAEIVAAQLADKFNFAGLFSGGLGGLAGLFGKGSSAGLSEIVITAARLAEGGKVRGPGTATSDSVPAMLSAGEFVVKASAVQKPGMQELLERINAGNGVFRGYAHGGYVYAPNMSRQLVQHFASGGVVQPNTSAATNSPSTVINQSITVHSPNGQVSRATEMQLTAATARGARIADRRNN